MRRVLEEIPVFGKFVGFIRLLRRKQRLISGSSHGKEVLNTFRANL